MSFYLRSVIHGVPKIGKTTFIGSSLDMSEATPILLDFEGGTVSIADRELEFIQPNQIPNYEFHGALPIINCAVSNRASDILEEALTYLEGDHPFNVIFIDSLTQLNAYAFDEIRTKAVRSSARRDNIDQAEIQDWGVLRNRFQRIMRRFRAIKAHVIFVATPAEANIGGDRKQAPYLQPSTLVDWMLGAFDQFMYYGYLLDEDTGEQIRVLRLKDTPYVFAGGRYPPTYDIPDYIENPTFETMIKTIFKEKE